MLYEEDYIAIDMATGYWCLCGDPVSACRETCDESRIAKGEIMVLDMGDYEAKVDLGKFEKAMDELYPGGIPPYVPTSNADDELPF